MRRAWLFLRRHWAGCLISLGVGAAALRPDLLKIALERLFQGAVNALVIVLDAAMTAVLSVVARNSELFQGLFVLAIIFLAFRTMFRGMFKKSPKK